VGAIGIVVRRKSTSDDVARSAPTTNGRLHMSRPTHGSLDWALWLALVSLYWMRSSGGLTV
jgi:hypothetical protein